MFFPARDAKYLSMLQYGTRATTKLLPERSGNCYHNDNSSAED
jgi:hypothetical protein